MPYILRVVERILSEDHHCLIGDIEWTYRALVDERGRVSATAWLWWASITLVPRLFFRDMAWQQTMLQNYLKVAFRQLKKYLAFSTVNVFGLALSMSVCLLMLTLVEDYKSYDEFHPEIDQLYRITSEAEFTWGPANMATSSVMVGPELLRDLDEVESLVQLRKTGGKLTRYDGRMASFMGLYAEPTFFDLFGFELRQGNSQTALNAPFSMVITSELAEKLFPDTDPIGQIVTRDSGEFEVTGVFSETSPRTHIRFDAIVSFSTLPILFEGDDTFPMERWDVNSAFYNYVRLSPNASLSTVEDVANGYESQFNNGADASPTRYHLQAVKDINLGKELSNEIGPVIPATVVWVLSIFAFILIGTAVFNYVNLTISRALKRTGEIGVRKVMGAHRRQLIHQYVSESIVTSVLSLLLAIGMLYWLITGFNGIGTIAEEGMALSFSSLNVTLLAKFLLFAAFVGTAAGIVPALRVSGVSPVRAFRGLATATGSGRFLGRKILVVFQFALSAITIITVIVLFRQSNFLLNAELGLNQEEILHLNLAGVSYSELATELRRIPGVVGVAATSHAPSGDSNTSTDIMTPEMESELLIQRFGVDEHFLEQYDIELLAGRNFSPDFGTDRKNAVILNEKGVALLGLGSNEDAIGRELIFDTYSYDERVQVIGVVRNFYSNGFENGYIPVSLAFEPDFYAMATIRLAPGDPRPALAEIERIWNQHAPGLPASYQFLDDAIQAKIELRKADTTIFGFFSFMIIIIACLGLLGMAMFSAEIRLKEVSIRKTLGADTFQLTRLLSAEYVRLIAIAILIAAPVSWIFNTLILSNFENSIDIGFGTILLGVLPILFLAIATIGSQTMKAAMSNPVDVMRSE